MKNMNEILRLLDLGHVVAARNRIGALAVAGSIVALLGAGTAAQATSVPIGPDAAFCRTPSGQLFQRNYCKKGEVILELTVVQAPQGPPGARGPRGEEGNEGPPGPQGLEGPEGPQGLEGPEGLQGLEGPQGLQGDAGVAGATGTAGPTGTPGATGAAGLQGPDGPTGPQGNAGLAGPLGPTGDRGDVGPVGAAGANGSAGAAGSVGPMGPAGPAGAAGAAGSDGASCWDANGNGQCDPGSEDMNHDGSCTVLDCAGPQGLTGSPGLKGDKGNNGDGGGKGDKGEQGRHGMHCWDLDDNGLCDALAEDVNHDGLCSVLDCQGVRGSKGDKGDGGPGGPKGDPGLRGAPGITHVHAMTLPASQVTIPSSGAAVTLAGMTTDPDTVLINAKMWLSNSTTKVQYAKCSLVATGTGGTILDSDTTAVSVPAATGTIPGAAAASFIIANSFTAPTAITLNCQRLDANTGSTAAYNIKVTVATVDAVSN